MSSLRNTQHPTINSSKLRRVVLRCAELCCAVLSDVLCVRFPLQDLVSKLPAPVLISGAGKQRLLSPTHTSQLSDGLWKAAAADWLAGRAGMDHYEVRGLDVLEPPGGRKAAEAVRAGLKPTLFADTNLRVTKFALVVTRSGEGSVDCDPAHQDKRTGTAASDDGGFRMLLSGASHAMAAGHRRCRCRCHPALRRRRSLRSRPSPPARAARATCCTRASIAAAAPAAAASRSWRQRSGWTCGRPQMAACQKAAARRPGPGPRPSRRSCAATLQRFQRSQGARAMPWPAHGQLAGQAARGAAAAGLAGAALRSMLPAGAEGGCQVPVLGPVPVPGPRRVRRGGQAQEEALDEGGQKARGGDGVGLRPRGMHGLLQTQVQVTRTATVVARVAGRVLSVAAGFLYVVS
jgi:hypothetical protein